MKKRIFSIFVALCMIVTILPMSAMAAECGHHTSHTEACGYAAGKAEVPCIHEHDASCFSANDTTVTSPDEWDVSLLDCKHVHDGSCGYQAAVPETPCNYSCGICTSYSVVMTPAATSITRPESGTVELSIPVVLQQNGAAVTQGKTAWAFSVSPWDKGITIFPNSVEASAAAHSYNEMKLDIGPMDWEGEVTVTAVATHDPDGDAGDAIPVTVGGETVITIQKAADPNPPVITYTLTLVMRNDSIGGDIAALPDKEIHNRRAGEVVDLSDYWPDKLEYTEGEQTYYFGNFFNNEHSSGNNYHVFTISDNQTLYAGWSTDKQITIIFEPNGGSLPYKKAREQQNCSLNMMDVDHTPIRSGYDFMGWSFENDGTADAAMMDSGVVRVTTDCTLYAVWKSDSPSGGGGGSSVSAVKVTAAEPEMGDHGGWDEITDELNGIVEQLQTGDAAPGETVTVEMNGATEVPRGVLREIAGQDVNVDFDMGDGTVWTVNGQDIPADIGDLNLGVETGGDSIPVNIINEVAGEKKAVQLELSHDGPFGTPLQLSVDLGQEHRGFWANLYYFDEALKQLVFTHASRIEADGTASWPFDHASSYVTVIDDVSHAPWENPFTDVAVDDWYYSGVEYVHKNGLMNGVSDDAFGPDGATSRGMIVAILYRMAGSPAVNGTNDFADVSQNDYFRDAVIWANEEGIASGYDMNTFAPNDSIAREQLAAMLFRYAKYKDMDVSVGENTNILSYNDAFEISEYAIPAVQWACGEGILSGRGEGNLAPQGNATRSEVASMLMRFLEE